MGYCKNYFKCHNDFYTLWSTNLLSTLTAKLFNSCSFYILVKITVIRKREIQLHSSINSRQNPLPLYNSQLTLPLPNQKKNEKEAIVTITHTSTYNNLHHQKISSNVIPLPIPPALSNF